MSALSHPLIAFATLSEVVPIHLVTTARLEAVLATLPAQASAYARALNYKGSVGSHIVLPGADGQPSAVLFGIDEPGAKAADPFRIGKLASLLPKGSYAFASQLADPSATALALCLEAYRFDRYRKTEASQAKFILPEGVDAAEISRIVSAVCFGRDLVNTPANDMGPDGLEAAVRTLASKYSATMRVVTGDDLLMQNFPMIHAVGRAASRAPRLIDLTWGDPAAPKVTLVGKGVCFDTGGLNIKPDNSMLLMKKDMGGAAAAIAAADMIMSAGLRVRLRLLIPAVENSISADAFRPGDVLMSRKGLSVEIGNTDAEGRLVLADALALADEESPDLIIDYATLTGAARVALGPDLPPFYSDDEALAADGYRIGMTINDPIWRMPLWPAYDDLLKSKIADVNHISSGAFAGSITAALFLRRFVSAARAYAHLDIFAWVPSAKPGRPEGGEVQGARLTYALLKERYGV
jgi:leucyl aminopeptidase